MPAENALELIDDAHTTMMRLAHGAERLALANGDGTARQVADAYKRAASIITDELRPEVERLVRERDAAYATIAGRDTPPTYEEIVAHHAAGGSWLVGGQSVYGVTANFRATSERREASHAAEALARPPFRWVALDDRGCPCAWPTVTP